MASRRAICIVCGCTEDEVKRMHYFTSNLARSQQWQENMGIKFSGDSLRNHRICSRHFTPDNYVGTKLRSDAAPTLHPCSTLEGEREKQVGDVPLVKEVAIGVGALHEDVTSSLNQPPIAGPSTVAIVSQPRQRLFKGIPNLIAAESTPRKVHLMNMIHQKEDQIRKLKKICKDRAHDIKALSNLSDSKVVRELFKGMSQTTADFLMSQLRCAVKSPHGRRWTLEEKVVALSIMKRSPKCYNLLKKFVALPSRRTLLDLLKNVPFAVGVNEHIFQHIHETLSSPLDRMCIVVFDEMDIKQQFFYDRGNDRIVGFEDFGRGEVSTKEANKALVFMCLGLTRKWKQPVAYYFCNNACEARQLVQCIKEVIYAAMHVGGLDVVATLCDMGSSNVKALKEMGSSLENPFLLLDEKKIFTMYDPPHLLKCIVALFRKYNVSLPVSVAAEEQIMEARFSDIVDAYNIDKASPLIFRCLYKLKDSYLAPVMKFAMKVNIAAQVMSRTVGSFIYSLVTRGVLRSGAIATATFVTQVDELFDSFNGTQLTPGLKTVKCAITEDSCHMNYWKEAFQKVKKWSFKRITKRGTLRKEKPPSQVGWMTTIRAVQAIWQYAKAKGASHLKPRYLNQDPLENLFGMIRQGCGSGDNPTAFQFIGSLKTQILNGLTNVPLSGTNCEADDQILLSNLRCFLNVPHSQAADDLGVAPLPDTSAPNNTIVDKIADDTTLLSSTGILSVAYVGGFLMKKILGAVDCATCEGLLRSGDTEDHNIFISFKEWSDSEQKLMYPSEPFVICVGKAITLLEKFIETYGGQAGILKAATQFLNSQLDFTWFTCDVHSQSVLSALTHGVCHIGLPWWAKRQTMERLQQKRDKAQQRKLHKMQHL